MKKRLLLISVLALAGVAAAVGGAVRPASASMSYECWAYKGGSPYKMVHVLADNNAEAVSKAAAKFSNLGASGLPVKCK